MPSAQVVPFPQSSFEKQRLFTEPSAQKPLTHESLQHSPSFVHFFPARQGAQTPPQSTSVSSMFWMQSPHVGFSTDAIPHCARPSALMQYPRDDGQNVLMQSVSATHPCPSSHRPHEPPPQSTPVSVPSWMPLKHGPGSLEPLPDVESPVSPPAPPIPPPPSSSDEFVIGLPSHGSMPNKSAQPTMDPKTNMPALNNMERMFSIYPLAPEGASQKWPMTNAPPPSPLA